jgi:hypothetical protein
VFGGANGDRLITHAIDQTTRRKIQDSKALDLGIIRLLLIDLNPAATISLLILEISS